MVEKVVLPLEYPSATSTIPSNTPIVSPASEMSSEEELAHETICSYLIGPQVGNRSLFQKNVTITLDELRNARQSYLAKGCLFPYFEHYVVSQWLR